jgi:hypothetical protein
MNNDEDALPESLGEFGKRLGEALWENVELLKSDTGYDNLNAYLYLWAIYLGVMALESFEGMMALLRAGKPRAANMLSRTLIDYNVRLRYYVIQALASLDASQLDLTLQREEVLKRFHAARDWENAGPKLASILTRYAPEDWPDENRDALLMSQAEQARTYQQRFSDMRAFLFKNEADVRELLPWLREDVEKRCKNAEVVWLVQSAFIHGDQAASTDVVATKEGKNSFDVHRSQSYDSRKVIFFTAANHVLDIMDSFGLIRGWALSVVKLRDDLAMLWFSFERTS